MCRAHLTSPGDIVLLRYGRCGKIFNLHLCYTRTSADSNARRIRVRPAWISKVVEQRHTGGNAVLVYCVRGCVIVEIVSLEVDNLGGVAGAKRLGHDKARVEDGADGPLAMDGLVGGGRCKRLYNPRIVSNRKVNDRT